MKRYPGHLFHDRAVDLARQRNRFRRMLLVVLGHLPNMRRHLRSLFVGGGSSKANSTAWLIRSSSVAASFSMRRAMAIDRSIELPLCIKLNTCGVTVELSRRSHEIS